MHDGNPYELTKEREGVPLFGAPESLRCFKGRGEGLEDPPEKKHPVFQGEPKSEPHNNNPGCGFTIFFFIPKIGKMNPFWRAYFSDGLVQPPPSNSWSRNSLLNYGLCFTPAMEQPEFPGRSFGEWNLSGRGFFPGFDSKIGWHIMP